MDNLQTINTVITLLDQLNVQGVRNCNIVVECIKQLGAVSQNLSKEKKDVQDKAE